MASKLKLSSEFNFCWIFLGGRGGRARSFDFTKEKGGRGLQRVSKSLTFSVKISGLRLILTPFYVNHVKKNSVTLSAQVLSNVSSVEEAVEDILSDAAKNKSNSDVSAEPKSKSPKYLPKFLRTSFSKLISKDKNKSNSLTQEPMSLPFFSSVSIPSLSSPTPSLSQTDSDTNEIHEDPPPQTRPCSPATQQFVEDSLAKGFPLIPFHYTSIDLVEKGRAQQRNRDYNHHPELEALPARAKYR